MDSITVSDYATEVSEESPINDYHSRLIAERDKALQERHKVEDIRDSAIKSAQNAVILHEAAAAAVEAYTKAYYERAEGFKGLASGMKRGY